MRCVLDGDLVALYIIWDIAQQSGFSSINSFNRAFLKITGMTPTQYRSSR